MSLSDFNEQYVILQTKISDIFLYVPIRTFKEWNTPWKKMIFLFCSKYHWKNRCFSFEANVAGIVRDRKKFSENRMASYNKASGKATINTDDALPNALINYIAYL